MFSCVTKAGCKVKRNYLPLMCMWKKWKQRCVLATRQQLTEVVVSTTKWGLLAAFMCATTHAYQTTVASTNTIDLPGATISNKQESFLFKRCQDLWKRKNTRWFFLKSKENKRRTIVYTKRGVKSSDHKYPIVSVVPLYQEYVQPLILHCLWCLLL